MRLVIILVFLLVTAVAPGWALTPSTPPTPRPATLTPFRLPNHHQREEGKRRYQAIQSAAGSEGLWDKVWGSDCFTSALRSFDSECRALAPSAKSRLAFMLTRCQLLVHGEVDDGRLKCDRSTILKLCLDGLTDREHTLYSEILGQIDVACLFIQNLNFEANAERVLNSLVEYGVENVRNVATLSRDLDVMLTTMHRQRDNATRSAAAFASQMDGVREQIARAAADIRDIFEAIHADAAAVRRYQESIKADIGALVELQHATTKTLRVIASDITRKDVIFYTGCIMVLVLATSIGVPSKPRGVYFTWLASVLCIERAFPLTTVTKNIVRQGIGGLVLTCWFLAEWFKRQDVAARSSGGFVTDPVTPRAEERPLPSERPVRRSSRARRRS